MNDNQNKSILLSIIVPVYNVELFLERCLNSIIKIPMDDLEIILINDGSTDNSVQICQKYKNLDSRILLKNQSNMGLAGARNTGLNHAKGKFVAFVDSDDWIDEIQFMKLVNNIEKTDIDVAYGGHIVVKGKKEVKVLRSHLDTVCSGIDFLDSNINKDNVPVEVWCNIYRRSFLISNNIRFVPGLLHEDVMFSFLCWLHAKKVCGYNICFYYYFMRDGSIMNNINIKNYISKLFICNELQGLKNKYNISSKGWDTTILSLYFDTIRHGKVHEQKIYNNFKKNNKMKLTFRSHIKKLVLKKFINCAKPINLEIENTFIFKDLTDKRK